MFAIKFAAVFTLINIVPGLALVFHFTRSKASIGIIDKMIISVILSPLLLILVSFIEEAGRIPQNGTALSFNVAVLLIVNIFLLVRIFPQKKYYLPRLTWVKGFVYLLFGALVIFRVWPNHDLLAPILHDPIAHAEWLKQLNISHFTTTEQWYPQGLELYLNYFATFLPASIPRIILISAGVIIAFFPISLFYLGLLIFKGKDRWMIFPLIVFVIATRLANPNELYYLAGKNSMMLAFAVVPFLLYLITRSKQRWEYAVVALLVFAAVIIHYPTGFFLLFSLFFIELRDLVSLNEGKLAIDRQRMLGYLTALATVASLGGVLLLKILPIYQSHPVGEDGSFYYIILAVEQNGIFQFVYRNFLDDQIQAYRVTTIIIFVASLSAFLVTRGNNKEFLKKLLVSYLALYLIGIFILLTGKTDLGVNYNVEVRFYLVFLIVLMTAWFFHYLFERALMKISYGSIVSGVTVVLLGLFFLYGGLSQYRIYRDTGNSEETVMSEDLQAFDFLDQSIEDDKKILIQLGSPLPNNGIIAGADSGAWIPTFTGKKVEVDFLEFTGSRSARIYDLYLSLSSNGEDVNTIRELYCTYDVGYVFFGSKQVFFNNMDQDVLENSSYFEKIYYRGASIYKIKPLQCSFDQQAVSVPESGL